MNKILRKILLAVLAWTVAASSAPAANVLLNPGFELNPIGGTTTNLGWNAYGGNAYSETSATQAHGGTNYFKVYQAFTSQVNYTGIYQDYISGPGAAYSANGWAYTLSSDKLAGQNVAWIEVSFRDSQANVLALYRSELITTNLIASGVFHTSTWINLPVTNQYNPNTYAVTNFVSQLLAPAGTYFVRYQIVFEGDANNSGGSVYFDDLTLAQIGDTPYGNWNIIWSDEFNGATINTNVWTYDTGNGGNNPGWGNSELEYYTSLSNNAYVSNGYLNIVAQRQSTNGFNYTSARMKSEGLFSFEYGRIEWRAKLPSGTGCWPALWMLGTNINSIGWPGCGEIDVMENNGSNSLTVQGSLHSGSDETAVYNYLGGDSATNFHTYTLDWALDAILFYVDGHLYETQTGWGGSTGNPYPFPFNQPFFFIMNLAIGGNYVNNPTTTQINAGTKFPAQIQVDYVRIYNQTAPLQLAISKTNSNKVVLSWPANIVCHLESQTNSPNRGIGTNWINVTTPTNSLQITPGTNPAFYRLESP